MNNQEWWTDALERLEPDERSIFQAIFIEKVLRDLTEAQLRRLIASAFTETKNEVLI